MEMFECSICLNQIKPCSCFFLDCEHAFHFDCIEKWYNLDETCPLCRCSIKHSPRDTISLKRKALLHITILEKQGYEPFHYVGITNTLKDIQEVEEEQIERKKYKEEEQKRFHETLRMGLHGCLDLLLDHFIKFDSINK